MNKKNYYDNYENKLMNNIKTSFYVVLCFALIIALGAIIKVFFPSFYLYIENMIKG